MILSLPPPPKDSGLNGAQVGSMVQIVSQVSTGMLPRESGLEMLKAAFLLTPEQAEAIMSEAGRGFTAGGDQDDAERL